MSARGAIGPGDVLANAGAALLGLLARCLPLRGRIALKERLVLTGRLDYSAAPIVLDLDTEIERFRLGSCAKEPETVAWLTNRARPGDVVWDVGANVGAYSLIAAHLTGPTGVVYAVEPGSSTFAKLAKNVLLNDLQERVVPLSLALSSETRLDRLEYSSSRAGAALHVLGGAGGGPSQIVPAFRLDALVDQLDLRPPDLMKIDVDGGELGVLTGAGTLLCREGLRSVLVEVVEGDVMTDRILETLSTTGLELAERHLHARSGVSNFIFDRR